jgi:ABC-type spermidine/putrescine transport system permease subunit I
MADSERLSRRLRLLTVVTAACYAIGYPLALGAHSNVGWVFVALGGPFLIALLITVIQRVHLDSVGTSLAEPPREDGAA